MYTCIYNVNLHIIKYLGRISHGLNILKYINQIQLNLKVHYTVRFLLVYQKKKKTKPTHYIPT